MRATRASGDPCVWLQMAARETGFGAVETLLHQGKLLALELLVRIMDNPLHVWNNMRPEVRTLRPCSWMMSDRLHLRISSGSPLLLTSQMLFYVPAQASRAPLVSLFWHQAANHLIRTVGKQPCSGVTVALGSTQTAVCRVHMESVWPNLRQTFYALPHASILWTQRRGTSAVAELATANLSQTVCGAFW